MRILISSTLPQLIFEHDKGRAFVIIQAALANSGKIYIGFDQNLTVDKSIAAELGPGDSIEGTYNRHLYALASTTGQYLITEQGPANEPFSPLPL